MWDPYFMQENAKKIAFSIIRTHSVHQNLLFLYTGKAANWFSSFSSQRTCYCSMCKNMEPHNKEASQQIRLRDEGQTVPLMSFWVINFIYNKNTIFGKIDFSTIFKMFSEINYGGKPLIYRKAEYLPNRFRAANVPSHILTFRHLIKIFNCECRLVRTLIYVLTYVFY